VDEDEYHVTGNCGDCDTGGSFRFTGSDFYAVMELMETVCELT